MLKLKLGALIAAAFAVPAFGQTPDFLTLDKDQDGQLSFAEYSVTAEPRGITKTLAAQEFTKMSDGQTFVTEDQYILSAMMNYDPVMATPPAEMEPAYTDDVAPDVYEAVPEQSVAGEVIELEVEDPQALDADIKIETPLESEIDEPEIDMPEEAEDDPVPTEDVLEDITDQTTDTPEGRI